MKIQKLLSDRATAVYINFVSGRYAAVWLVSWLLLAGWIGFGRDWLRGLPPAARASTTQPATADEPFRKADSQPRLEAVAMSQMKVGDQVPADNPTGEHDTQFGETVDPPTWRKIVLLAAKANGRTADIELLRPLDWLHALDARVGGIIRLELAELGIEGTAKVVAIEPCPPINHNRALRIVTGTFKHRAETIVELHLDGVAEPIGTTPSHPFWSEDRQQFVVASDLRPNERLLGFKGPVSIRNLVRTTEPEPVFNIEVQCDHVYHVGVSGLLVHNVCPWDIGFSRPVEAGEVFKHGEWAGYTVEEAIAEARLLGRLPPGLTLQAEIINGSWVAANNRTLYVAQQAGLSQVHPVTYSGTAHTIEEHLRNSGLIVPLFLP